MVIEIFEKTKLPVVDIFKGKVVVVVVVENLN